MARCLQYLCSAMLRQCSLQGPLECHQSELSFWSYVFFVTLAPFWNPGGSIFEVPGTLGQHWAAFWLPWFPRPIPEAQLVDLFDDFGHPLSSKWVARALQNGKPLFEVTFWASIWTSFWVIFQFFCLKCWYKKHVIFGARFLCVFLVFGAIQTSEI